MNFRAFWILTFIMLAALVIRTGAAFYWELNYAQGGFYYGDSDGYWSLGQRLADTAAYEYQGRQIFRAPGYPAFLAILMSFFGGNMPILYARLAGAAVGTLSVWLVWKIGNEIGGEKTGLIAAGIAAGYPEFVLISPMILSEGLFCLTILAQFYFWVRAWKNPTWKNCVLMGFFAGAACWIKPGWILFTPAALGAMGLYRLYTGERSRRRAFQGAAAGAVMILILFPWAARNYSLTGKWIFGTLQAGPSLMDGLNPYADGSSEMSFMNPIYDKFGMNSKIENIKQEILVNDYTQRAALKWLWSHPGAAAKLAVVKFARTWSPFPNQRSFSSLSIRLVFACPYILLLIFSLYSPDCSGKRSEFWLLCILTILYLGGLHCVFVGSLRYRLPAMWLICILAASHIAELKEKSN